MSDERPPDLGNAEPSAESGNSTHIHKPKPLHGAREFLSEIGVIVVGVLIALGLEQAVESLHWGHKVEQAEVRLRMEAKSNGSLPPSTKFWVFVKTSGQILFTF